MNKEVKIKALIELANEAISAAADAWELADAYAGGDSENADEISERINKLEARLDVVSNS